MVHTTVLSVHADLQLYHRWHAYDRAVSTQIGQYLLHGSDSLVALMWPQQRGGVDEVSP